MNHHTEQKTDNYITTTLAILFLSVVVGGALYWKSERSYGGRGGPIPAGPSDTGGAVGTAGSNVSVINGTQYVTIRAKGGYQPRTSVAKAGLPTMLRFDTQGTFDCSAAVRVPSLGISRNLPFSGQTDISVGTQLAGVLKGSCGMGMYPFEVRFE